MALAYSVTKSGVNNVIQPVPTIEQVVSIERINKEIVWSGKGAWSDDTCSRKITAQEDMGEELGY